MSYVGKHLCPHCGKEHDSATAVNAGAQPPADGDVGICSDCFGLFVFHRQGNAIRTEATTMNELDLSVEDRRKVRKMMVAIRIVKSGVLS